MLAGDRGGQAYLLRRGDALALVDTGSLGNGPAIDAAIRGRGADPAALTHVVLTRRRPDHAGSAAELRARPG